MSRIKETQSLAFPKTLLLISELVKWVFIDGLVLTLRSVRGLGLPSIHAHRKATGCASLVDRSVPGLTRNNVTT